jgi:hypothetical protein
VRTIGLFLLFAGAAGSALAVSCAIEAPEIDAASAAGAVALLSGALLVIRARRRPR